MSIARLVFVEARRNPVGILHDVTGIVTLGRVAILIDERLCGSIRAHRFADVEVAIAESLVMQSVVHPIPVASESTRHHFPVVATEETVEGIFSFSLQSEAVGIDELYDVIASEARQQRCQADEVPYACQRSAAAPYVNVALQAVKHVAVANECHLMSQLSQALGNQRMQSAIVLEQQYSHFSFFSSGSVLSRIVRPRRVFVILRNHLYF